MIAMLFGSVLLFGGYRFFIFLLPIFGFFWGFTLGAQAIQAIFGDAFLSTVTSWVVGFISALVFAVLSYVFYFVAVALISGALGYALGLGFMEAIGFNFGLLVWIVGVAAGVVLAIAVLVFNVQKFVVIAATAILGAATIIATLLYLFGGPAAQLAQNPVRVALQASPFWAIMLIVLAVLGGVAQFQSTRHVEIETYNRFAEVSGAEPEPVT
jgi:hypothetical protein